MKILMCFVLCFITGARSWDNPWDQFQNNMGSLQQRIQANVFNTMDQINRGIQESFQQNPAFGPMNQMQVQSGGRPFPPGDNIDMGPSRGAPRPFHFNPMGNMFNQMQSQMQGMFNNPGGFSGGGSSVQSFSSGGNGGGGSGRVSMFVSPPAHWSGPNVCVDRKEEDESEKTGNETGPGFFQFQSSNCQDTEQSYVCTNKIRGNGVNKILTTKYQCCYGYRRVPGQPGCQQTVELKDMVTTMNKLGLNQFPRMIERAGFMNNLEEGNFTVFCPSDEAVMEFQETNEDNEVLRSGRVVRSTPNDENTKVLAHIVPGFVTVPDLADEKLLQTQVEGTKIRVNIYHTPQTVYTINCARVISVDNFATNGVVHILEKMVEPSTKSVADIISEDSKFSIFKSVLAKSGVLEDLRSSDGQVTVFAPSDEAFNKMDQNELEKLKQGQGCAQSIVKHHILPHIVCSGAVQSLGHARTLLGSYVNLRRDLDNNLFIGQDAKLTSRDLMATNGVIHVIDNVLIPRNARMPSQILAAKNLTAFLDLVEETGMRETLDTTPDVTVFAPTNRAIMSIPENIRKDIDAMKNLVKFHLGRNAANPQDTLYSGEQMLPTMLDNKTLRLDVSDSFSMMSRVATVQCVKMVDVNNQACQASLHVVEKVLFPPKGDILELIGSSDEFSILAGLLQDTGVGEELSSGGPYTFLAPTDQAFNSLPAGELDSLLNDIPRATRMLKNHILPNVLCCQSANPNPWFLTQEERALGGNLIAVRRDNQGRVHFGNARATGCDVMTDNGVVHSINRVIGAEGNRRNGFEPHIRIFDF